MCVEGDGSEFSYSFAYLFVFPTQTDELTKSMLPAISMSALNLFLPFAFRIIASLEQYQLPKETIAVSLFRYFEW